MYPTESEIPEAYRFGPEVAQTEYLVNGQLRYWPGPYQRVVSPIFVRTADGSTPKVLGSYPLLTEREALESLVAAVTAYDDGRGTWPTMSVEERIQRVEQFTQLMVEQRSTVVKTLMWEIGKSAADSEKEFDRTVQYIRDTIDALKELDRASSRFTIEEGIIGQIRRAPLGVVLCMGPYNYPLNETFTTLIPALIMGNTVVFKPPRLGVLLHRPLLEAFRTAFPAGVVNTVYGEGARVIGPIMSSGEVHALAFIGSSAVANHIRRLHPKLNRLRCVLGLEAKNPAIVLRSANLETAVRECVLGSLSYNGQRCTALKIFFVHSQVVEQFTRMLSEAVARLHFGMPWEKGVFLTPLPDVSRVQYLQGLVEDATLLGAVIANEHGGTTAGTLFYPAILSNVTPEMRVHKEEQFGPVLPVVSYDVIETPLRYIVESDFGQQVSIFGENADEVAHLIDPLVNQVCRVNLNAQCQRGPDTFPFTGRKDSAESTLSVSDALRAFSIRSVVSTKATPPNKELLKTIVREHKSSFLATDYIL
ncbi:MAG: NADP-dependent glyceraldehyde-3-phosphate dehydrogenase [Dehalococcoidia bacterium]|nr:NADP-dependent glyceraldehyde-3-phosphate dehydrogenase [Dehalococcoidia bacterium]